MEDSTTVFNSKKRLLIGILLLMLAVMFAACGETEPEVPEEPEIPMVKITEAGVTDYWVIRSDFSKDTVTKASVKVRKTISEITGAEPGITTDWDKNPVYEHEIIVGETLREEGLAYTFDRIALGETGYVIKELDGKIYIVGGTEIGTSMAVDFFLDTFVKRGKDVEIPKDYEYIHYHEYDMTLYINMMELDDSWKIIVPRTDDKRLMAIAEKLRNALYDKCGAYLEIAAGKSQAKAFVISDEKPEQAGVHTIDVEGDRIVFRSSAATTVIACVDKFINMYITDKFGKYNFPADYKFLELGDYMIVRYPESKEKK